MYCICNKKTKESTSSITELMNVGFEVDLKINPKTFHLNNFSNRHPPMLSSYFMNKRRILFNTFQCLKRDYLIFENYLNHFKSFSRNRKFESEISLTNKFIENGPHWEHCGSPKYTFISLDIYLPIQTLLEWSNKKLPNQSNLSPLNSRDGSSYNSKS